MIFNSMHAILWFQVVIDNNPNKTIIDSGDYFEYNKFAYSYIQIQIIFKQIYLIQRWNPNRYHRFKL